MAKSSSTVPTNVPSGSATTRYWAISGIAPPEVMRGDPGPAAGAQPAVDRVAMQIGAALRAGATPSLSIVTIASKSARVRSR